MIPSPTFPVALTPEAHNEAQQISEGQAHGLRAKQAYLSSLARFAVRQYLHCMGLLPEPGLPDPASLAMALLSDSAALSVAELGQLECCAVLPGEQHIRVPPEAQQDRIGYVAVQLDASLNQAQIIGFAHSSPPPNPALAVAELGSLAVLLQHLYELRSPRPQQAPINLTHWFQNTFEQGWQICNDLLRAPALQPAMGFRSPRLTGKKPIDLGYGQELDLVMTLVQKPDHRTRIEIQVVAPNALRLPPGLKISVLDEQDQTFLEAQLTHPSSALSVQPFTGAAGEQFTLAIQLEGSALRESFIA